MIEEKILDAMEFIDDDYINQVYTIKNNPKSRKTIWIKYLSVAACIVFVLVGVLSQKNIRDLIIGNNGYYCLFPTDPNEYNSSADNSVMEDSGNLNDATDPDTPDNSEDITNDNPNNDNPKPPIKDEPPTEPPTESPTEAPTEPPTEPPTEEPTTEPIKDLPPLEPPLSTTRPLHAYVKVVDAYDDKFVIRIIDNKGNDKLIEGEKYEVTCFIYDDSVDEFEVGKRYHIMCAFDDGLVVYSIKKASWTDLLT